MENQTPCAPVVTSQVILEQPKQSNFLIILLSILLFISVVIAGFFAYRTQKLVKELTLLRTEPTPIATSESVVSPELTFEQDKTLDPTANWKIYVNKTNQYSIRYPNEWFVSESTDQTTIANFSTNQPPSSNKYVMYIGVYKESVGSRVSLIDWLKQNGHYISDTYGNPISTKETTIAGNQAVILNYEGESDFYVFSAGTHVFWAYPSPESSDFSGTFKLILSKFKFTK